MAGCSSSGNTRKVVQERLGHAQISLTMDTYSHLLPGVQRSAADRLDGDFRKAKKGRKKGR